MKLNTILKKLKEHKKEYDKAEVVRAVERFRLNTDVELRNEVTSWLSCMSSVKLEKSRRKHQEVD